jgi:peptidoglycan/xylan/chitin deacetylase (PgdA/CDA1 family)
MQMHQYFIKTPWLVKKLFPHYIWSLPSTNREVYLTFDDGPHIEITPWVLNQLRQYNALASFFCIGKNVLGNPGVYKNILDGGHAVGNHTQNHLNGWKVNANDYLADIKEASKNIETNLFRPPYGRIKQKHLKGINAVMNHQSKIIMWDVLSADFDQNISKEQCLQNVIKNVEAGSIIVFHDSEKAYPNLKYVLPKVLQYLAENNFSCSKIELATTLNN